MNGPNKSGRNKPAVLKPIVLALALAMPGGAVFAADMGDVVNTRADQNIDEQYGRDSVYAFSREAKPLKPEQTGTSHSTGVFDKTKAFVAGAWDRTTSLFTPRPESADSSLPPNEPQRYGRAGGYAGSDRVEVLGPEATSVAAGSSDDVKTGYAAVPEEQGEQLGYAADARGPYQLEDDIKTGYAAVAEEQDEQLGYVADARGPYQLESVAAADRQLTTGMEMAPPSGEVADAARMHGEAVAINQLPPPSGEVSDAAAMQGMTPSSDESSAAINGGESSAANEGSSAANEGQLPGYSTVVIIEDQSADTTDLSSSGSESPDTVIIIEDSAVSDTQDGSVQTR